MSWFCRGTGGFEGFTQSDGRNWFLIALGDSAIRGRNRITEFFSIIVKPINETVARQFTGLLQWRNVMVNRSVVRKPKIDPLAVVHTTAVILGDVHIGANCRISPGVCIDGTANAVDIGANTTIGSNCVIESTVDEQVSIGQWVTIQPGAVVLGATVGNWSTLGANSVVGEGANVGTWAFLAEGAVLRPSRSVPDSTLSSGILERVVGEHATDKTKSLWRKRKQQSLDLNVSFPSIERGQGKK